MVNKKTKLFIEKIRKKVEDKTTPLSITINKQNLEKIKKLLNDEISVSKFFDTLLASFLEDIEEEES